MSSVEASRTGPADRWIQLVLGVVCMVTIANLQYGWVLFVAPMEEKFHWERASIQLARGIFVLTQTWIVPAAGWLADRFGPRPVMVAGGALVGLSWMVNAGADSLSLLYASAGLGGIGAGAVYGTCVGNALRWFPDRRGLAVGLVTAGYGAGAAITALPIMHMIAAYGYAVTFLRFGLGQGLIVLLLGLLFVVPRHGALKPSPWLKQTSRDSTPGEMLRQPAFWVTYAMFALVGAAGLSAIAQLPPIAHDFGVADMSVGFAGLMLPALSFALAIDRVLSGLTRPFFGWLSDHLGRENTMALAFCLQAAGIGSLFFFGRDPGIFVLLSALVYFTLGEIYSLFPAICADTFGVKYAATNAGFLYTAKGTATLLAPVAAAISSMTGSWHAAFILAVGVNALAALAALCVLKPMRERYLAAEEPQRSEN